jgi:DNA mismatch repair protein MutL
MYAFCLDYPHIHFKFFTESGLIFNYPAMTTLLDRCIQLWQPDIAQQLIEVFHEHPDKTIMISGVISDHQFGAYDRSNVFFLVNKRWVKNQSLCSALLKGYHNVIAAGRFPIAVIDIRMQNSLLDINIHPRKEEVRFMHPRIIEQLIQQTVHKALENRLSQQLNKEITIAVPYKLAKVDNVPSAQDIFLKNFDAQNPLPYTVPSTMIVENEQLFVNELQSKVNHVRQSEIVAIADNVPLQKGGECPSFSLQKTIEMVPEIKIIGQYNKTYILIEQDDGLLLIDQHAAHERILYELFVHRFEQVATITLLFPYSISLSAKDMHAITPYLSVFMNNGIAAEIFDMEKIIIRSTPVYLKDCLLEELFYQTIGLIYELQDPDHETCAKQITEKLHAQMACKAAVKAGDSLTQEQMKQLISDLAVTNNRFFCPHGRPTNWLLRLDELERKFKRKT